MCLKIYYYYLKIIFFFQSFVKKVSSRVSGILPSISKWFSREENKSTIRYRDEEEDDDLDDDDDDHNDFRETIQPPAKKLKLPSISESNPTPTFKYNNFSLTSLSTPTAESSRHEHFAEPIAGPSGVKSRKLVLSNSSIREQSVRIVNGDNHSDSGDSTSGYSSMARIGGSKEVIAPVVEKQIKGNTGDEGKSSLFNRTCK